jgi:hypothetical protein
MVEGSDTVFVAIAKVSKELKNLPAAPGGDHISQRFVSGILPNWLLSD